LLILNYDPETFVKFPSGHIIDNVEKEVESDEVPIESVFKIEVETPIAEEKIDSFKPIEEIDAKPSIEETDNYWDS